MTDKAW